MPLGWGWGVTAEIRPATLGFQINTHFFFKSNDVPSNSWRSLSDRENTEERIQGLMYASKCSPTDWTTSFAWSLHVINHPGFLFARSCELPRVSNPVYKHLLWTGFFFFSPALICCSPPWPALGRQVHIATLVFYLGDRDQNSGQLPCVPGTSSDEP